MRRRLSLVMLTAVGTCSTSRARRSALAARFARGPPIPPCARRANNDFNCIFTTQDIPIGQPCGFINDCAVGLACLSADTLPACDGSACCSAFCDLELGDGPCEAFPGTACMPFFAQNMALPGYEQVGVCVLP